MKSHGRTLFYFNVCSMLTCIGLSSAGISHDAYGQVTSSESLDNSARKEILTKEFKIHSRIPGVWLAEGSLGKLNCNETFWLDFRLINKTGTVLDISRPKTNCSCSPVTLKKGEIELDSSVEGKIRFTCPKYSSQNSAALTIDFQDAEGNFKGRLLVNYDLRKNLFAEAPGILALSKSGVTEFKLPITLSELNRLEDIEVTGSESFACIDLITKIEKNGDNGVYLSLSAATPRKDSPQFIVGRLSLRDKNDDIEFSLPLTFQAFSELEIAPTSVNFIETAGNSNELDCNVVLKINDLKTENDEMPIFVAKIGESNLKLKSQRLSKNIFRIKISTNAQVLQSAASDQIHWEVQYGNQVFQSRNFFLFTNDKGE